MKLLVDHKVKWLPDAARALLGDFSSKLTPAVSGFVQHAMDKGASDKAQLARQGKLVPALIERLEQVTCSWHSTGGPQRR